jgi:hypothetical protein
MLPSIDFIRLGVLGSWALPGYETAPTGNSLLRAVSVSDFHAGAFTATRRDLDFVGIPSVRQLNVKNQKAIAEFLAIPAFGFDRKIIDLAEAAASMTAEAPKRRTKRRVVCATNGTMVYVPSASDIRQASELVDVDPMAVAILIDAMRTKGIIDTVIQRSKSH